MEKKAPERKVRLREEDVFYVYDKRINRCIKENCEGTVKYGLILKVIMPNDETMNSYECNRCHMKYTPYPNYVRLSKPEEIEIYNKDEVAVRDRKRAEDAAKEAAKNRKKQALNGRKPAAKGFDKRQRKPRFNDKQNYNNNRNSNTYYYDDNSRYDRAHANHSSYSQYPDRICYDRGGYSENSFDNSYRKNNDYRQNYDRNGYNPGRREYNQNYTNKPFRNSDVRPAGKPNYTKRPIINDSFVNSREGFRDFKGNNRPAPNRSSENRATGIKKNIIINDNRKYNDKRSNYNSYKNAPKINEKNNKDEQD